MSESGKKLGDASVWVPSWRRREASGTGVDKSNARATRQDSGDSPGAAKQSWRAKSGGSTGSKSTGGLESWSQARVQGQSTSSSTWRQEDGALPSGRHHRRSSGESWGPRSPGGPRSRSQSRTRASSTTSLQGAPARSRARFDPPPEETPNLPEIARHCFRDPREVVSTREGFLLASRLGYMEIWSSLGFAPGIRKPMDGPETRSTCVPLSSLPEAAEARYDSAGPAVQPERIARGGERLSWNFLCRVVADGTPEALSKLVRTPDETTRYRKARAEMAATYASMGDAMLIKILGFEGQADPSTGKLVARRPRLSSRCSGEGKASVGPSSSAGHSTVVGGERWGGGEGGPLREYGMGGGGEGRANGGEESGRGRERLPLYLKGLDGGRYAESMRGLRVAWLANEFPYAFEDGIEHHCIWSTEALSGEELSAVLAVERPGWETRFWVNPPSLQSVTSVWHAHVVSKRRSSVE